MVKVGEHITIDFLGVKKDYAPEFYEKIIYTIAKAALLGLTRTFAKDLGPYGITVNMVSLYSRAFLCKVMNSFCSGYNLEIAYLRVTPRIW